MGLASLRLDIGVFCDFLSSFLLFGAFSGLDFLGRALSRPQVGRRTTTGRTARCAVKSLSADLNLTVLKNSYDRMYLCTRLD
jgi:hypothetical protein